MNEVSARTASVIDALQRAWGHGQVVALDAILSPDYTRHGQRSSYSREALKASILDMRRAFPDLTMTIVRSIENGDDLAIHWTSTGTLMDSYLGLPPTGRTFSVSGVTFSRFRDDRIVDEWVTYDRRGEYKSLGLTLEQPHQHSGDDARPLTGIDSEAVRDVHRKIVTGVTVVALHSHGEPRGLAVNAFASVSLEPPLILICVQKSSSTYSHLIAAQHFAVNVLASDQQDVANTFATKQPRKFETVKWHPSPHGAPFIDGACANLEVELQDTLHASTHTIFIGRVVGAHHTDAPPLIYTGGRFFDGGRLEPAKD